MSIGVLASGNGSNLQALLDDRALGAPIRVVVANRPEARALERARAAGVEAVLLDHTLYADRGAFDAAVAEALVARGVTWVVLAGFMRIIGPAMLAAFPQRIVNVHPSLLPAFPGLHAQRQALAAGVRISGCTVHLVDAGMDTGPILAQAAVPVAPGDDEPTLSRRILAREHQLLPAVVRALVRGELTAVGGRPALPGGVHLTEAARAELGLWLASPSTP
jgi:phosphoribosylglycinamide formyltransferase-1